MVVSELFLVYGVVTVLGSHLVNEVGEHCEDRRNTGVPEDRVLHGQRSSVSQLRHSPGVMSTIPTNPPYLAVLKSGSSGQSMATSGGVGNQHSPVNIFSRQLHTHRPRCHAMPSQQSGSALRPAQATVNTNQISQANPCACPSSSLPFSFYDPANSTCRLFGPQIVESGICPLEQFRPFMHFPLLCIQKLQHTNVHITASD